jgi:hypothetical protein
MTDEERFEEKFRDIAARLSLGHIPSNIEQIIYNELRREPNEDAGVLAFRIKGLISRAG